MNWVYRLGWIGSRTFFAGYCRWRVLNPERVPAAGPALLASNHASFLDPLVVGAAVHRDIHFLARETLFRFPLNLLFSKWNAHPLDRDSGSSAGLRMVLGLLKQGQAVLIFPEGTRTRTGNLQPSQPGIGLMVAKARVPVIPVRVFGSFEALARHHRYPRPARIAVKFGHPLDFSAILEHRQQSRDQSREKYRQIAEEIMRAIAGLHPWADTTRFPSH